jgi:RNA polymerase sigma-70 factor, ECF subfamily
MAHESIKKEFIAVYEKENDALFRFCFWRVSDREVALEITQETFARLWSRMASGREVNPRGFIYLVARRLIIDWYRKSKPRSLEAFDDEDRQHYEPVDEGAAARMETSPDAKRALEMISRLGDQYREVVYLSFVEELAPREIAVILNLTPNAVSIRLTRGLEALRKLTGIEKIK